MLKEGVFLSLDLSLMAMQFYSGLLGLTAKSLLHLSNSCRQFILKQGYGVIEITPATHFCKQHLS